MQAHYVLDSDVRIWSKKHPETKKYWEIFELNPKISQYFLVSGQAECHMFLVKIAIVQFQSVPFQPIGLKAHRNKEFTGFFAGKYHCQVDLLEIRKRLRIGNGSL